MNEKQAIAEAERRFSIWWKTEGWIQAYMIEDSRVKLIEKITKEAWMNGAFCDKG